MGKAVISIDGDAEVVDHLAIQMRSKDVFKDYEVELVRIPLARPNKILIIVSDIDMDGKRI